MTVGENIRRIRQERHLTQRQCSKADSNHIISILIPVFKELSIVLPEYLKKSVYGFYAIKIRVRQYFGIDR